MKKKIIPTLIFVILSIVLTIGGIRRTQVIYGLSQIPNSSLNTINEDQNIILDGETSTFIATAEIVQIDLWMFQLDDGRSMEVEGRALTYMSSLGFAIAQGQQVSLQVFRDTNGALEISQITNLDNGNTVILRGVDGKPAWGKGGGDH